MQPLQPIQAPEGLGLEALQLIRIQHEAFPGGLRGSFKGSTRVPVKGSI